MWPKYYIRMFDLKIILHLDLMTKIFDKYAHFYQISCKKDLLMANKLY